MKDTKFTIPTKAIVYKTANVEINPIDFIHSMRKTYNIEDEKPNQCPLDNKYKHIRHYPNSSVYEMYKVIKTVKGNTFNSERADNTPCLAKQTYFIEKVPGTNDIVWEEISDIHRPFYITDDPKIISLFEALNALETAINNLNND